MDTGGGQTNHNDESLTNTGGTLVSIKFGEEERRALRWIAPLLIVLADSISRQHYS